MHSFIYGSRGNASEASVLIGPLICNGVKPLPKFANDCKSLKAYGLPSAYYVVEENGKFNVAKCATNDTNIIITPITTNGEYL